MGQVISIIFVIGFGIVKVARGESFCIGLSVNNSGSIDVQYGIGDTSFKISFKQASSILPKDGSTFVFDPNNEQHRSIFVGKVPSELPDEVLDVDSKKVMKFKDGKKLQGASIDSTTHLSLIKSVQNFSLKIPKTISVPPSSVAIVRSNNAIYADLLGGSGCGLPNDSKLLEQLAGFAKNIGRTVNDIITAYGEGIMKDDMHDATVGYFIDKVAKKEGWTQEKRLEERKKLGVPLV